MLITYIFRLILLFLLLYLFIFSSCSSLKFFAHNLLVFGLISCLRQKKSPFTVNYRNKNRMVCTSNCVSTVNSNIFMVLVDEYSTIVVSLLHPLFRPYVVSTLMGGLL
jgi:hypothetical protein